MAGDRRAFGALVDRHLPAVVAVVSRIVCNQANTKDLAQDTFVRAFERLGQYGQAHSFRNWLLKIATNLALNHLQARRQPGRYPRIAETRPDCVEVAEDRPEVPGPQRWQHWLARLDESSERPSCCSIFTNCRTPRWRRPWRYPSTPSERICTAGEGVCAS